MERLFVALPLPDEAVERLVDLQWGLPRARWSDPDQLHVTVAFVGEVRASEGAALRRTLADVDLPPVSLVLRGVGHFPGKGAPRVVWAGVEPTPSLLALKRRVDQAVGAANLRQERRRFRPHVTLARLSDTPSARVAEFEATRSLFRAPPMSVESVDLMRSVLLPEGADYQRVQRVQLRG